MFTSVAKYCAFCIVRVNGLEVSGSPFHVDVAAGPARGSNATVSGTALVLATAGRNASFIIQARDRAANPIDDHRDGENASGVLGNELRTVFNVTLTKDESGPGWHKSGSNAIVVAASVEYIGERKICRTYWERGYL